KAGIDDRLVFLAHRLGDGEDVFLLGLVIGVALPVLDVRRRDRRHKDFFDLGTVLGAVERRFQVVDVALKPRLALVGDRAGADHVGVARGGVGAGVKLGERLAFARRGPLI